MTLLPTLHRLWSPNAHSSFPARETSWRVLVTACLLLAAIGEPALAQQRLFAASTSEVVELDPRPASLGAVIRRFPMPGIYLGGNNQMVPFAGGEFLAGVGSAGVLLLNTRTGDLHPVTFPGFSPVGVLGTDGFARLLVLGYDYVAGREVVLVADARSGGMRFLDMGRMADDQLYAYAPAADLLFVCRPVLVFGGGSSFDIDVIRASTGTLVKTIANSHVFPSALTTNASGTRLFVTSGGRGTFAVDVASETLLASNTSDWAVMGLLSLDEQRNRLVSHVPPRYQANEEFVGISAFAADSLRLSLRMQVPELPLPAPTRNTAPELTQRIDFSGVSSTLFVLQAVMVRHQHYGFDCHESQLIAFDADTGALRQTVSTTQGLGSGACRAALVRVTEPAPPIAGFANVDQHQVTLSWEPSFSATHYELDVGSAPGLDDLARFTVGDPRLVVDYVPSGVYYVRVRAINAIGRSGASPHLRVVVP